MLNINHSMTKNSELGIVIFAISTLLILFIPIPDFLLDLLLIINFSWALTVLLLTFYTDKPLSFSTFPALLLLSTLFRLALNISATRLILADGKAGDVIQTMGQYVIQGNYVMGFVVFLILIIIQYVVVTNGSQRVAEVAARFTLDSMPGKQMSIDADLNMGIISHSEAKLRRSQIEKEANFYGAMDGASKFVKGDALAGVLILLVDILGGFAIGIVQKGLSFSESIQRYTLLTVGDGLVTQIPALIISTATGIIVTRAATDAQLGNEIIKQLSAYPKTLIMVCCGLLGLISVTGMPRFSVMLVFSAFAAAAWFAAKKNQAEEPQAIEQSLYEKIKIYPIEIHFNEELFRQFIPYETSFLDSIQSLRERIAHELGFVIPEVKIISNKNINFPFYKLNLQGNALGCHQLHLDKILVLIPNPAQKNLKNFNQTIEVRDPSYGLPAFWIELNEKNQAIKEGYTPCDPLLVLSTHLKEAVQNHLADLLNRNETELLLSQTTVSSLRDDLIPNLLSLGQVQRILQNLLQEKVPIRNLAKILETLIEQAGNVTDLNQLTEIIRTHLGVPLCQSLIENQSGLHVLTLAPKLEQKLNQGFSTSQWALEPNLTEHFITALAQQVEKMLGERKKPILLCSSILRRNIKLITQRVIPHLTVLAMSEVPVHIQVESFAVIQ